MQIKDLNIQDLVEFDAEGGLIRFAGLRVDRRTYAAFNSVPDASSGEYIGRRR